MLFSWSIFIFALQVSAAVQTSFTPVFPGVAVATPFVGNTANQCMRSCINDVPDSDGDPCIQEAFAACLQSRCSITEQEATLQLRCNRAILVDSVETSPLSHAAGVDHTQAIVNATTVSMSLKVDSGFIPAVFVSIVILLLQAI